MTILPKLLTAALSWPLPWYAPGKCPETPDERDSRVTTIVVANYVESRDPPEGWGLTPDDLAWAGLVVTYHESRRWSLEVHDGSKRGDNDASVCLGQIHGGGDELAGVDIDATRRCFRAVNVHLATHWRRCLSSSSDPSAWNMGAVFSGYGTGHSCNPLHDSPHIGKGWALKRGQHWWRVSR